jgi:hypothetical protein
MGASFFKKRSGNFLLAAALRPPPHVENNLINDDRGIQTDRAALHKLSCWSPFEYAAHMTWLKKNHL